MLLSHSLASAQEDLPTFANDQRQVVIRTFDRVTIEISKGYFTAKGTAFPKQIKSITDLEAFLERIYPDEGHELRQAVLNLHRYRDLADRDTSIGTYVRQGINRFAVDLNGRPLAFDRQKVDQIIDEMTVAIRPPPSPKASAVEKSARGGVGPGTLKPPDSRSFIDRHAFWLTISLLLSNTITILALIFLWTQKKPSPHNGLLSEHTEEAAIAKLEPSAAAQQPAPETPEASTPIPITPPSFPPAVVPETGREPERLVSDVWAAEPDDEKWLVVKASVPGKLHTDSNPPIPCQDSCFYQSLGDGWGIAVVCDGAGSKKLSHLGAEFVAEKAGLYFRDYVMRNRLIASGKPPSDSAWHENAQAVFLKIRIELDRMASEKYGVDSNLLSCTVIVVIHSPVGLMTAHVGDGRAAFCNTEQEWKAIMKPQKGEEANQTVFITALDPNKTNGYVESTVIRERPVAFTLMSDGCESHSFEVNIRADDEEKYWDPNQPYPKFFQPLVTTLKRLYASKTPKAEIDRQWTQFIESGSEKLKTESDDKTMILGVLLD